MNYKLIFAMQVKRITPLDHWQGVLQLEATFIDVENIPVEIHVLHQSKLLPVGERLACLASGPVGVLT